MTKRTAFLVASLFVTQLNLASSQSMVVPPVTVRGVEITATKGWFAVRYAWQYLPDWATVHPVSSLWQSGKYQSPAEINEECRLLNLYGSGADILEYNPNPDYIDRNLWLVNEAMPECRTRPRMLAYEHVFGTRYDPADGSKNMNLLSNRRVFEEDIQTMLREFVLRDPSRYLTLKGRAIIYLWSVPDMMGNFASLLDEMRGKYPVAFIGSVNIAYGSTGLEHSMNVRALDGFMEYAIVPAPDEKTGETLYGRVASLYSEATFLFSSTVKRVFEPATKRKYPFISTFQIAFDNRNYPGDGQKLSMYPRNRKEVEDFAKNLQNGMRVGVYSPIGPLVVWNEIYEGGAAIPSQCLPETIDTPTRFVGCGTVRAEILRQYFGK